MRCTQIIASALVATVAVAGCTTNPYTGESEASKASIGAGIGALAGAVLGAATGDDAKERRKRALIGAGAGAIAGGGVGYYMDVQEAKLREQLKGTGVSVTRVGENIVLNMPGNITFQTGSADLNTSFLRVLDSVGIVLKEYNKTLVVIAGHTDNVGTDANNQSLSERRAAAVGTYLAGRAVAAERMVITGYGESRPVASNESNDGRNQNRRVELTLEPIKQG
ncbi:MAG TPA: OmpA family protein [Verrucomicrobiae bacterium]|nr:OmpA family protein [Verrucomicrobiae bacterium]